MTERPILFSAPMVRAILAGTKRQTRRTSGLDKVNDHSDGWSFDRWQDGYPDGRRRAVFVDPEGEPIGLVCPYDVERLWVRETWMRDPNNTERLLYRANDQRPDGYDEGGDYGDTHRWRPSIHMPRWASRITLAVESVRVERLQDIGEEDAKAEGVEKYAGGPYRTAFARLWQEINGAESWDANPWVWVIGFSRVEVTNG